MIIFFSLATFLLLIPMLAILAHAQSNVTPITTPPTIPTSNIELLPQQGYIVPLPPKGQEVQVQQEGNANGEITGIIGIVTAIGMSLYAKMTASKDVKNTNAALLNTKGIQKELARVMYNFNPPQAEALKDAPSIKMENLEKDEKEFGDKVAKS